MSALGLLLVLIGAGLVAAEAHVPSHGALGAAAVASLAVGVALLVSAAGGAAIAAILAALAVALAGGLWITTLVRKVVGVRRLRPPRDALVGTVGVVKAAPEPLGQVYVGGSLWRAKVWGLDEDERPLHPGDRCVVERVDGLTLTVRPAEEWELI
jgi:membrane-bound serine protease (ClpP class)